MQTKEDFLTRLNDFDSPQEINQFLVHVSKTKIEEIQQNFDFLLDFLLETEDSQILEALFYCLLFKMKSHNRILLDKAIEIIKNRQIYIAARVSAVSGIGAAYTGTKNKNVLLVFKSIFQNSNDDYWIRISALLNGLIVFGFSARYVFLNASRLNSLEESFNQDLIIFEKEIGRMW